MMKTIKVLSLFVTGVSLVLLMLQAGCDQRSADIAFTRGELRYVVDPLTGKVSVFSKDGVLLEIYRTPAAGHEESASLLPPAIIHFLLLGNGSISGLVWNDLNGNRQFDADENPVANIRVYVDQDNSDTYSPGEPSRLTDENGFYAFGNIKPGVTKITLDQDTLPGGYGITTSQPITVNLARKEAVTDADFGIRSQGLTAELDGTVWDQSDNLPIGGLRIYVDLNNDDKLTDGEPTGTTDASGNYVIADIPAGTFKVHADNGTLNPKYHRTPVQGANPTMVTFASDAGLTVNLAYIHKATICGALKDASGRRWSSVTIFIDLNNNGAYDDGEPTTVTDGEGNFCFDELMPGEYTLLLKANPQWDGYFISSPAKLTVGEGDSSSGIDFLLQAKPVTISGLVWDDDNGSTLRETEEKGLAGVTVFLDNNNNGSADAGELSAVTDSAGAFLFSNLEQGTFVIRADDSGLQDAYTATTAPNPVLRTVGPGQSFDGAKFGFRRKLAQENPMTYPTRIDWGSNGNLYASDSLSGSVFILDSTLQVTGELKGLAKPLGVAVDESGNIHVGNRGRQNVEVYSSGGTLLRTIAAGEVTTPNDIAIDRDNNVYILDSASDRILVYNPEGEFLTTITDGQRFEFPVSIAISYRNEGGVDIGELFVADQPKCTIHAYSLDGSYLRSLGSCGTMYTSNWDGKFSGLVALDADRDGNIHGLDNNLNVVQVFAPGTGAFLRSYNAYLPDNADRPNLQTDLSINPADSRVVMGNFETKQVETIETSTTP